MIDTNDRNELAALVAALAGGAVVAATAAGGVDEPLSYPVLGLGAVLVVAALAALYRLRTR